MSDINTDMTRSSVGLMLSSARIVLAKVGASGLAVIESIEAFASAIPASNAGT